MSRVVEAVECCSAEEMLEILRPSNEMWGEKPATWVYRGHPDSYFELRATAHRAGVIEKLRPRMKPDSTQQSWVRYEEYQRWMLSLFKEQIDNVGLPMPSSTPRLFLENTIRLGDLEPDGWPLKALAQHYGLPTDLLDWTRNSRNAAYFAAAGAATHANEGGAMDVWALQSVIIGVKRLYSDGLRLKNGEGMRLYRAPQTSNPNLFAQQGVFTVLWGSQGEVPSVDQFIERYVAEYEETPIRVPLMPFPVMRRISLPRSCAPKLLRLLSYEGVTGATMFPGYSGVVKGIAERGLWDRADD